MTLWDTAESPFTTAMTAPVALSPSPRTLRPEAIQVPAAGQVPRVREATVKAWAASSGVAYAVATCRALGAFLPLLLSTRRIFCCETGWPGSGSPPKQAGTGASSESPRWVSVSFQVRLVSIGLAWPAVSIISGVSRAPVVGGSDALVVGEGPTEPAVDSAGGGTVPRFSSPRPSTT